MSVIEAYIFLFSDALMSALLVPVQSDLVFPVMDVFGYSPLWMMLVACIGAIIACVLNYLFGRILPFAIPAHMLPSDGKVANLIRAYAPAGLLFVWLTGIGSLFVVILGYVRYPLSRLFLFSLLGFLVGYGRYFLG